MHFCVLFGEQLQSAYPRCVAASIFVVTRLFVFRPTTSSNLAPLGEGISQFSWLLESIVIQLGEKKGANNTTGRSRVCVPGFRLMYSGASLRAFLLRGSIRRQLYVCLLRASAAVAQLDAATAVNYLRKMTRIVHHCCRYVPSPTTAPSRTYTHWIAY